MKAFWTGVAIMLLIAGVLWLGHDYLQEKTDIHNPDSPVGEAIDEAIPGVKYHEQYTRARNQLSNLELLNIRTAITMYITKFGRNPSSLEDLVDTNCIGQGALQDSFRQDYRLREVDGQMVLMSSGTDQILGTDDDITMSLHGTMLEIPASAGGSESSDMHTGSRTTSSGRSLDMIGPAGSNQTESTGLDDTSVRIP